MEAWLRKDVIALVKAYTQIKDQNLAKNVLNLVESMAEKENPKTDDSERI